MLVVKIEIWPGGLKDFAVTLGTSYIWRTEDLKDDQEVYTYCSRFEPANSKDALPMVRTEHIRRKGFWSLVSTVLTGALTLKEQKKLDRDT